MTHTHPRRLPYRMPPGLRPPMYKYVNTPFFCKHVPYGRRMGTNFRGWLNFAVFEGTSQTAKNTPGKIFVRLRPRRNTLRCWARQAREWRSFVTLVQPLTTQEKLRVLFSFAITCSVIHEYHRTTTIQKGRGNYTHNKSAKIKTYENLIIKMIQQKREILTPRNFVPIQYYSNSEWWCTVLHVIFLPGLYQGTSIISGYKWC